jgi:hypothetical protein
MRGLVSEERGGEEGGGEEIKRAPFLEEEANRQIKPMLLVQFGPSSPPSTPLPPSFSPFLPPSVWQGVQGLLARLNGRRQVAAPAQPHERHGEEATHGIPGGRHQHFSVKAPKHCAGGERGWWGGGGPEGFMEELERRGERGGEVEASDTRRVETIHPALLFHCPSPSFSHYAS